MISEFSKFVKKKRNKSLQDPCHLKDEITQLKKIEAVKHYMECNNPKEMISELDRKYRGPGAKSAWELLRDFDTIKFQGSI
ncbi:hypothetical protein DERF_009481 [Dermatophagoides farinae]|uniref:Uncharacterized protein n=1 Tax=Dermatophagoides farinae TaxID=6954 RepID=A0A922HXE4_DERFA|nr:hypothetical protein DERF_009481 [Dermatophagoides farinae]